MRSIYFLFKHWNDKTSIFWLQIKFRDLYFYVSCYKSCVQRLHLFPIWNQIRLHFKSLVVIQNRKIYQQISCNVLTRHWFKPRSRIFLEASRLFCGLCIWTHKSECFLINLRTLLDIKVVKMNCKLTFKSYQTNIANYQNYIFDNSFF